MAAFVKWVSKFNLIPYAISFVIFRPVLKLATILWLGFPEKFSFLIYVLIIMIQIFGQKVFPSQTWKLSNANFWPKSKIHYSFFRKLFYLKLFARLSLNICIKGLGKTWNYEYIEVWKRVEQVMRKHQFLQTILEIIFGKKLKTQTKLDQTSKLWYLFLINFWPLFIRVHF